MAKFFSYYPKIQYSLNDDLNEVKLVTNILFRFEMEEQFKNNSLAYYFYNVNDGEKPEDIAYKVYGSSERHWIILMMNNIIDPLSQWPLDYRTLVEYIIDKYENEGGYEWAKTTTQAYIIRDTITTTDNFGSKTTIEEYEIDQVNYGTTVISDVTKSIGNDSEIRVERTKYQRSYFEYEEMLNESKRLIKIPKKESIKSIEKQFRELSKASWT